MEQQPKEHIPLWWDAMWWILAILAVASALCGCFPKTPEEEAKEKVANKTPTAQENYEMVQRRVEGFRKFLGICEQNGGVKDFRWDSSMNTPWYGTKMTCGNGLVVTFNGTEDKQ